MYDIANRERDKDSQSEAGKTGKNTCLVLVSVLDATFSRTSFQSEIPTARTRDARQMQKKWLSLWGTASDGSERERLTWSSSLQAFPFQEFQICLSCSLSFRCGGSSLSFVVGGEVEETVEGSRSRLVG